jgi:hypothetical protein
MAGIGRLATRHFRRDRGPAAEGAVGGDRGARRLRFGVDAREACIDQLLLGTQAIGEALDAGAKAARDPRAVVSAASSAARAELSR